MQKETFIPKFLIPHKERIAEKEVELKRLSGLYQLIISPVFEQGIIQELITRQLNAEVEHRKCSDKGILSIWFYLKRLWQVEGKIEMIEDFLGYLNSIPEQLKQVSEEYNNLTK